MVEVYSEKVSGTKETDERVALKNMMHDARLRKFEKVLVWSVDRLGRSMKGLVMVLSELKDLKVDIFAYKQAIDTSTAMGAMFFQFVGIFSEFENNIRKERQLVGIRKAKERGGRFGRKPTSSGTLSKRQAKQRALAVRNSIFHCKWITTVSGGIQRDGSCLSELHNSSLVAYPPETGVLPSFTG